MADGQNRAGAGDGRAYGFKPGVPDEDMARVGPGTPGGELLRRYWQPLAASSDAGKLPKLVKIFGEELILFCDGSGKPGLLYPRCAHRGTSLLYGRVEEKGIRCCYHGWLFDTEGKVVEMACEPGVQNTSARQPWYPLVEKYGLIFVYMGPPEKQPVFPRFSVVEDLAEDEFIVARGGLAPTPMQRGSNMEALIGTDYNWWNFHDNVLDPFHLYWLHGNLNGIQFVKTYALLPEVEFQYTKDGVRSIQHRDIGGGRIHQRMGQALLPNMNTITPLDDSVGFGGLGWTIGVDDTNFRTFTIGKMKKGADPTRMMRELGIANGTWGPNKPSGEAWTLEDHQNWQSDYVCQKGQGDISLHSEEHLSATDTGLAMFRRMFRQQAERVQRGEDPIGVTFDEPYLFKPTAANCILDAKTMQAIDGPDGRLLS
ncbi:MAG: Rieske 2Fe-2S domain-containing protein [Alphaproteobacteria bacterium]